MLASALCKLLLLSILWKPNLGDLNCKLMRFLSLVWSELQCVYFPTEKIIICLWTDKGKEHLKGIMTSTYGSLHDNYVSNKRVRLLKLFIPFGYDTFVLCLVLTCISNFTLLEVDQLCDISCGFGLSDSPGDRARNRCAGKTPGSKRSWDTSWSRLWEWYLYGSVQVIIPLKIYMSSAQLY